MNKQDKDKDLDQEAEQHPSDRMLSSLLHDFLTATTPPDSKSKILARLEKADSVSGTSLGSLEHDEAMKAAASEIINGYGNIIPPPVVFAVTDDREFGGWVRSGIILVASLAAALLAAVLAPTVLKTMSPGNKSEIATRPMEPQSDLSAPADSPELPDKQLAIGEKPTNAPEIEPSGLVVKDLAPPKNQALPYALTPPPANSLAVNAMKDTEIVSVIDSQLNYLWKRVGATPAAEVPADVWLDRIAIAVLGRPATGSEKESFRSNKSENKFSNYVDGLVSSGEFSRFWSMRLAEHYLGKRLRGARETSMQEQEFVDWLEESVGKKAFVGDLEREMIAGPGKRAEGASIRKEAAAYWLSEWMERAAAVQRDSVDLVSLVKKREPRDESLIGVARQLMRLSGNPSMVCSQCHVDETNSSDLRGYVSMPNLKSSGGSSSFWKVPASLSGFNLKYQNSERSLRQDEPKDYFYEDAEGKMMLAKTGLPSLTKTATEKASLEEWFRVSSEPRRAMVDMVWEQVFKQPLVPAIGLLEEEGWSERVDLRDLLASQMQTRQADLGTVVRWVVLSKAIRLEGLKTDTPWYLKSTESQIAASQKQMRVFASFPRTESINVQSGKIPIGRIASWIEQKPPFQKSDSALAQGANVKLPGKNTKPPKLDYSEDQVRFFISVDEPYRQIKAVSDRWARSSMPWPMLVEHAYLASDARFPTPAEREEAAKLLDSSGNDRMRTLVMVVNARLGSW